MDSLKLAGSAAAVIVIVGASFWLALDYQLDVKWVFVLWNSILLIPLLVKNFRNHLKKPAFAIYLLAWCTLHGLFVVSLMRWVPGKFWLILVLAELTAGYLFAYWIFGIEPKSIYDNSDREA